MKIILLIILVSISLCSLLLGKVSRHDTFFLVAKEVPPLSLTPELQLNFSTVLPYPAASSCVNQLILPTVFQSKNG